MSEKDFVAEENSDLDVWMSAACYEAVKLSRPSLIKSISALLEAGQTKEQIMNRVLVFAAPYRFIAGVTEGAVDHMITLRNLERGNL